VIGYKNLTRISKTLETILMRRTKDEVLKQLPERLEKNYFVPMTSEQMKYHEENREIVAQIVAK
jgi:SNF2 family DNA or RNA helicase